MKANYTKNIHFQTITQNISLFFVTLSAINQLLL